ncbi:MAG TPA: hypothetical protein VKR58_06025 [Aquella sp.]|nr:hypothetical protein [Aquella sp.]
MPAFSNIGFYINTYAIIAKRPVPKLQKPQILSLQAVFRSIKDRYEIPNNEIRYLISYSFLHNPLKLENISEYGQIGKLIPCAIFYNSWKKYNRQLIQQQGLQKAILNTRPNDQTAETELLKEIFSEQ